MKFFAFKSFSVKAFYKNINDDETLMRYLSDRDSQSRAINKRFIYGVLATIWPHFLKQVVVNAMNLRCNEHDSRINPKTVTIDNEMLFS